MSAPWFGAARTLSLAISCFAGLAIAQVPTSASYDALVDRTVSLIQSGDFVQAAQSARDSIALDSGRYEGYLYLGITRFRQEAILDAEAALQKALSLAPPERRPKVQEALDLVSKTGRFRQLITTATQAENDGARAKAARIYAEAWQLFPDRVDIAARAMKGLTATNSDFEAARVWNALTPAQKKDNAKVLQDVSINTREVKRENDRRRPLLEQAIGSGQLVRAVEIATPMAQADPSVYATVLAALLFLTNDQGALRFASPFKPEQLIRMDFFTEAQATQMVQGPLFHSYLEDVVGGSPDRILAALQPLIDKPRLERRDSEQLREALASAKGLPDSQIRLKAIQQLRVQYPSHTQDIDPEIRIAARSAAKDIYSSIAALFGSLPRPSHPPVAEWQQEDISRFFSSGKGPTGVSYKMEIAEPCKAIKIEGEGASPFGWSKFSYAIFQSLAEINWSPRRTTVSLEVSEDDNFQFVAGRKVFRVRVFDSENRLNGWQSDTVSMMLRPKEIYHRNEVRLESEYGLNFYFDRREPAELLRNLLGAAQDACLAANK